jgi:hypothetical protein
MMKLLDLGLILYKLLHYLDGLERYLELARPLEKFIIYNGQEVG